MSQLSDKELDRLSREAAERYQPDEDISSWEKLSQLLDRELPNKPLAKPPRSGPSPLFYGALVLLLGTATFFILKSRNNRIDSTLKSEAVHSANNQSKENSGSSSKTSATKQARDLSSVNQKTENPNGANRSGLTNADQHAVLKPDANFDNPGNSAQNGNSLNQPGLKNSKKISNPANSLILGQTTIGVAGMRNSKNAANKSNYPDSRNALNNSIANAGVASSTVDGIHESGAASQDKNLTNQASQDMRWAALPGLANYQKYPNTNGLAHTNSGLLANSAKTGLPTPGHRNQSLRIVNPLKIGFMIAPDYSNVKSADNNQLSINVGLTLGYQIANRWSINTGFIYTVKNYAAKGQDFHGPKVWTPAGTRLEYVKGTCNMIEIPLNMRYDFSKAKYTTFFATAGLSSYLMKNESYDYYFSSPYYGTYPRSKDYNTGNSYILSIGALSVGMERQLGNYVSLQVEPFIRVPFTGVGVGNLQLNSYGVSFSLRYAPVFRSTRH
ncbi:MAG: hypothetical protein C5B59_13080 [Bacteroidetes bacterium]|nr:MAG: hypothetical protein C5B59_13080 [Bacteroidota bacterium]